MNLVDLDGLNATRFPKSPRSRSWLSARARRGELPGARKMGGTWLVDLDTFDAASALEHPQAVGRSADLLAVGKVRFLQRNCQQHHARLVRVHDSRQKRQRRMEDARLCVGEAYRQRQLRRPDAASLRQGWRAEEGHDINPPDRIFANKSLKSDLRPAKVVAGSGSMHPELGRS